MLGQHFEGTFDISVEGENAEFVQLITGTKFASFLKPNMASKNDSKLCTCNHLLNFGISGFKCAIYCNARNGAGFGLQNLQARFQLICCWGLRICVPTYRY